MLKYILNKKNYLFFLLIIFLSGVGFSDTNGVWHRAEDVRSGIFGSDEGFNSSAKFIFRDNVNLENAGLDISSNKKSGIKSVSSVGDGVFGKTTASGKSAIYGWASNGNSYSGFFEGGKFIVNNGNVGIGTSNPSAKLDIDLFGNRKILFKNAVDSSGIGGADIRLQTQSKSDKTSISFNSGDSSGIASGYLAVYGQNVGNSNKNNMILGLNNGAGGAGTIEGFLVRSSRVGSIAYFDGLNGNVGIGTRTPQYKFQVGLPHYYVSLGEHYAGQNSGGILISKSANGMGGSYFALGDNGKTYIGAGKELILGGTAVGIGTSPSAGSPRASLEIDAKPVSAFHADFAGIILKASTGGTPGIMFERKTEKYAIRAGAIGVAEKAGHYADDSKPGDIVLRGDNYADVRLATTVDVVSKTGLIVEGSTNNVGVGGIDNPGSSLHILAKPLDSFNANFGGIRVAAASAKVAPGITFELTSNPGQMGVVGVASGSGSYTDDSKKGDIVMRSSIGGSLRLATWNSVSSISTKFEVKPDGRVIAQKYCFPSGGCLVG